jgi:hypothetical protein
LSEYITGSCQCPKQSSTSCPADTACILVTSSFRASSVLVVGDQSAGRFDFADNSVKLIYMLFIERPSAVTLTIKQDKRQRSSFRKSKHKTRFPKQQQSFVFGPRDETRMTFSIYDIHVTESSTRKSCMRRHSIRSIYVWHPSHTPSSTIRPIARRFVNHV